MSGLSRTCNDLLQALPTAEFELLRPHLETVDLAKQAVLLEAGAPVRGIYLPHSGSIVSLIVSFAEGETVELAKVGRDSILGAAAALHDGPSLADAIVVVPGKASMLPPDRLREAAARSSTLRRLLVRHEQAQSVQTQQSAACHASHMVEARLSRWLLQARDLRGDGGLPLTQEALAQLLGVRRNAVSIVAHALQQAGLIRYSRGHIEIIDVEGLRKTTCECYAAAKMQRDRLLDRR